MDQQATAKRNRVGIGQPRVGLDAREVAVDRFLDPPPVLAGPMLAVALVGLAVNLGSMKLLAAGSSESLNVKSAYFEVMGDMLGSLGVIIAATHGVLIIPAALVVERFGHARPWVSAGSEARSAAEK